MTSGSSLIKRLNILTSRKFQQFRWRSTYRVPTDYSNAKFLDMGVDKNNNERKIAYVKHEGHKKPGIIFIPGYFAPMNLPKNFAVEEYCVDNGFGHVKYEAEGTGISPGIHKDITLSTFVDDGMAVLDRLTDGPQILVANSIGSWVATIMGLRRPERIHSIVLVGFGYMNGHDDEFEEEFSVILKQQPLEVQKNWHDGEVIQITTELGTPEKVWKSFYDTVSEDVGPEEDIPLTCPIRMIHVRHDETVPYLLAMKYLDRVTTSNVDLIIRKSGNHRLMKKPDRVLILEVIESLIKNYPIKSSEKDQL